MAKYKVVLIDPDGTSCELDEIFDTESEAEDYGLVACSDWRTGAKVLHLSNPGDNPYDEDDSADYEVIEVDD